MTLARHIEDTLKEWQLKMGGIDNHVRLFYPFDSLMDYLGIQEKIPADDLARAAEDNLSRNAPYLGRVRCSESGGRMCVEVPAEGCAYVEANIPMSEFLVGFLDALKCGSMDAMREYFRSWAEKHSDSVREETDEDDGGTILYFESEDTEPYVYCLDEDIMGITYHRFAKIDYERMKG